MITYSIIDKSQLEGAHRLDAEYYQPEYLHLDNILRRSRVNKIIDLSIFVKKGIFDLSPDNYQAEGIPFIRVQNIRNGFVDTESLVFISEESHRIEKKTELTSFDLVLSKVGTIGEISIIPSYFPKANFSQNVIGIKIDKDKIHAGFLLAYLLSKLGQLQIARVQMFSVQSKLELQDIRDLKVIRFGKTEEEINQTIIMVEELFNNAKSLYSQAEDLLLQELGLKGFKAQDDLAYIVKITEIKSANRMDAEYFHPKYESVIARIKKHNVKPLGELVTMKKGFEPGSDEYQEQGKMFLRVSNISRLGFTDKEQKYLSNELYQQLKSSFEPQTGDILLTKDATPGIAYVLKEPIEGIIASGIMRLKIKEDIDAEYLTLCINSLVCQMQVERDAGGSIIVHWKPEQIKNLLIPILPKPTQQKIAGLVRKSHEAHQKAKALLEEAKQKVEDMISGE